MREICQKYASKIEENLDSLAFLYGGNQINFELLFKNQANSLDKINKKMKVLVYKNEGNIIKCPNCNEKIKLKKEKIDDIISSNEFILDTLNGIKVQLDNIIKNSKTNLMNNQLKNINIILNTLTEVVKKNNYNLKNLFKDIIVKKKIIYTNINANYIQNIIIY